MKAKNCTRENLQAALDIVNMKYEGNIKFKSLEMKGKQFRFTLTVISSKGPGHRRGFQFYRNGELSPEGKRLVAACWHVHGDFFNALLDINPLAVISVGMGPNIDRNGGNWIDRNVGSQMYPLMFSEACDCGKGE